MFLCFLFEGKQHKKNMTKEGDEMPLANKNLGQVGSQRSPKNNECIML